MAHPIDVICKTDLDLSENVHDFVEPGCVTKSTVGLNIMNYLQFNLRENRKLFS